MSVFVYIIIVYILIMSNMKPSVMEKLKSMSWPKWIDLSIIMGKWPMDEMPMEIPMDMPELEDMEMPEVWAETIYAEIKDKLMMLDSDEVLKLLHTFLMERIQVLD